MINPNGDVFIPRNDLVNYKEEIIGNLVRDDWDKILLNWSNAISMANYKDNIKNTFKLA